MGTQSWHEPSISIRENTASGTATASRNETLMNSHSMHQSSLSIPLPNNPQSSTTVMKPIYVSIDHQAMIAERGVPAVTKRTPKPTERHSAEMNNGQMESHRARAQTHQPPRTIESTESNTHRIPLQSRTSNPPRSGMPVMTASVSSATSVPNRQMSPSLHSNLSEHGSRINRARPNRPQSAHVEKVAGSAPSSSRTQSNSQSQSARQGVSHTNSPLRTDSNGGTRRVEHRSAGSPMMRIPISQHPQQHQSSRHRHGSATQRTNSPLRADPRAHQRSAEARATSSPMMTIPISQQTQRHKPASIPSDGTNSRRTRM